MNVETNSDEMLARRAALHRALGDERRLAIVDALAVTDLTVGELADRCSMAGNLLAFHLGVLEGVGIVRRRVSEGDRRRRYVGLNPDAEAVLGAPRTHVVVGAPGAHGAVGDVLFVCTANSARSQLAAHLWQYHTGQPAVSAGTRPADRVHPGAVRAAAAHGLDITGARPRRLADIDVLPGLVVSVCDRANEEWTATTPTRLHWSVPDPVRSGGDAFDAALDEIDWRVRRLALAA